MKVRFAAVAVIALSLLGLPQIANSAQRSETKPYLFGGDALLTDCELDHSAQLGAGGACFELNGNETKTTIKIHDFTARAVPGIYSFHDSAENSLQLGQFCGSISNVSVPPGAVTLYVYPAGPVFGVLNCPSKTAAATTGEIEVIHEFVGDPVPPGIDIEKDCLELVPATASVKGVTDGGNNVDLNVRVLLDGVDETSARSVFQTAAKSYESLGITMVAAGFEQVSFTGTDAQGLVNQSKAVFGGKRPAGSDIVYTLTNKDIQALGQTAVAGLADCLGGVRYADRAFAVGEVIRVNAFKIGPLTFYRDATGRTIAHEIGHLMGGQHHAANCVEGATYAAENSEGAPCTVMFNSLDTLGPVFGTANGAVVRGHANDFAAP